MKVSLEEVSHIAALAHLELRAEEAAGMQRDLSAILDYIGQLNELDTAGVEPMAHVLGGGTAEEASEATLRGDEARTWFSREEALANAPAAGEGMFLVPKIIDRG